MSARYAAGAGIHAARAAMEAEIERVSALALPHLAAEVMNRGFGPGGPGGPDEQAWPVGPDGVVATPGTQDAPGATAASIAAVFAIAHEAAGEIEVTADQRHRLELVIAEGLQILEHECLIRPDSGIAGGELRYLATRLGRAAVERGEVDHLLSDGNR